MRHAFVVLAALALSACNQSSPTPAEQTTAAGCVRSATHDVRWTDPDTADLITARSEGPSCAQAVVLLVARNAQGDALWNFSSTYYDMTTGGVPPENAPAVSDEQMDTFLRGWANVTAGMSGTLPEWREGAAGPEAPTFHYSTSFEREQYEAMRQRNLPMICYAAAAEATQCLVVDPISRAPSMIVAYGP